MTISLDSPTDSSSSAGGDWSSIAARKVAARDALIPEEWRIPTTTALNVMDIPSTCGVLTPLELSITVTEAPKLVEEMVSGQLKSHDVVLAFCKRAAIAQQLTNCLTEILFTQALETAKKIDSEFETTRTPLGPLHGLPVSLKDNFNISGVDSTVGFVGWANEPMKVDSEMTKLLKEQGAVLFCKTNVPTAMMIAESYNNVWGYTCNPYNRNCSSGGSSGGESALLALKGSPLGVGTDIGGSIRIPASFCNLFGLKPSFGRFPTYGARSGMPGQEAVRSINGPMSSSLAAVELWAKSVVESKPWERDPNMLPIPWRSIEIPDKLCFGIIMDNGIVKPTPPVTRALLETKAALEAAGHKVIEWSPYKVNQSKDLIERFFVGDGGHKIANSIAQGSEPWPIGLATYAEAHERSKKFPPLVGHLWDTQAVRTSYAKGMLDHWMGSSEVTGTGRPIDGVISPVTAYSACPKHTFKHVTYTSIWNITDQSSCVFPVSQVVKSDIKPDYTPKEGEEKDIWDRYDPEEVIDCPVALQMVCQKLEEEKTLKLVGVTMSALESARK